MILSKEHAKEILEYINANPGQTLYSKAQILASVRLLANKIAPQ